MIWQVTFGDRSSGAFRVEFADNESVPGNTQDSITVLHRSHDGDWRPVPKAMLRIDLVSEDERTLY